MKNRLLPFILSIIVLLSFYNKNFAQAPNFGSAANFVFFTSSGAVGNTGVSNITGDIGTNLGAITNFNAPSIFTGNSYIANVVTAQAVIDLNNAYTQLNNIAATNTTHTLTFGNGETLTAGVYSVAGAASVSGTLSLDAQGDATKIFIFKTGGAFTTAASTTITLVNGTLACNVFWIAEGTIAMAASTIMKGSLIAHNAANSMGAGGSLEGRMFSTGGAVTVNNVVATIATGCTVVPMCTDKPVITTQPLSTRVCNGQSSTFSVVATGSNLTYQWRKGGVDIPGATSSSYNIASSTASDAGSYNVIVIGSCSPFATSSSVTFGLITPGTIINLGTVANFVLFTSNGAIDNTKTSQFTGDIGTNLGAITGFAIATINGATHNSDAATGQCVTDLQNLYTQLNSIVATNTTHNPVFGLGETLTTGVYSIGGAASLGGTLTLDAQGDATKIFIFKIGGAFTTGASTTINLTNGASACNVYWIAEGAISMAASTSMKGTLIAHNAAISMAANGILEGRMLSTTGAVSINQVSVSKPTGCIANGLWTGAVNTDWYTNCNWYTGLIPTNTTSVTIPSGLVNYPVINTGFANVANISIQNNASLMIAGAQLNINGSVTNAGTFTNLTGTIEMNSLSPQNIPANTFVNNSIFNLIINNNVSLSGTLNIIGTLSFGSSNNTLSTNGFLTLKSTATGTARLADITHLVNDTTVTLVGNTIVGNTTVERYFPARRAWRMVTAPLSGAGSIFNTWQNGGVFNAGIGTYVTGTGANIVSNGMDVSPNNNISLRMGTGLTSVSNTLTTLLSVNTNNLNNKADNTAFFIFVRGDRTASNYNINNSNTTTLSSTGKLQTGNIQFTFLPTDGLYNMVGNPYASPVDFSKLNKTNLGDVFYTWDPYLNSQQGGYITMSGNPFDPTADYIQSPVSPAGQTKIIQSSQAFFVIKNDASAAASLNFSEPVKSLGSINGKGTFRPMNDLEMLRTNLYLLNTDGTTVLADGNLVQFDNRYTASVDNLDAIKFSNSLETLGILCGSTSLSLDRRPSLNVNDTIFFKFTKSRQLKYQFEFIPSNLNPSLQAVLEDSYTGIPTPLSISNTSTINFLVDGNAASQVATRFRIVFTTVKVLPVTYTTVKAYQHLKDVAVNWTVENELNINKYEVEKSTDGVNFTKVYSTKVIPLNGAIAHYNYVDVNAIQGNAFYRIKNINLNGSFQYSRVVKVVIGSMVENISVYPNPVVDGVISLQLSNQPQGKYKLRLINNLGQIIFTNQIIHAGGTALKTIVTTQKLVTGTYELEVTKPNNTKTNMNVLVK